MLEALGNIGDFIGGIAVIATLVYLAIQVRQNTQLIRANALSTTASASVDFNYALGNNPASARVFQLGLEDFRSLTEDERRQFLQLLRGMFTSYEHTFQQYERGMFDATVWHHTRASLKRTLLLPHVAVWWERRKEVFTPSFVEELDRTAPAAPSMLAGEVIAEMLEVAPVSVGSNSTV